MTPRRPTPKSVAPQLSLEIGSPQTLLSHKDATTSSKQNPKDTTPIGNPKEWPLEPHSSLFKSQLIIQENQSCSENQACGFENQSDPTLNELNQPESQNPIHSSDYYDWFDCRFKDDD